MDGGAGRWCESQPEAVPYRGHCFVQRAELLLLHGRWDEALEEANRAREWYSSPRPRPGLGEALYIAAELQRRRGELSQAEEAYREAARWQRVPRPGFALLRLAQGQVAAARAAARQVSEAAHDDASRAPVLEACVEISLAAGDAPAARRSADELLAIARRLGGAFLAGLSARATGAVRLAEGEIAGTLAELRAALGAFRDLSAPYEVARTQVQLARACEADGVPDLAAVERDAAA
ncbi:MAG TPA: hypothetical protein VFG59_20815 [Anaeromyxobacter sp.]|nr:hypothetical protein [Anaeromyxobacter sp.]